MASAAHPVRSLRDQVTALEAALTLALAAPKPKAVHRLRTTTRRIEAQLELLLLLPDLPEHTKPAGKARKLLSKLRRAAGRVRDLDVQRDLTPARSQEARHLVKMFMEERKEAAEDLIESIQKHQPKLARALEKLLKDLSPAESLALSSSQLIQLTLRWYAHNTPARAQSQRQLHDVRKAAKLARYIAESASSTPKGRSAAHRLARTFESLQQSGGDWHDWLTLSEIAHRELGSSSPLTQSFTRHCNQSLTGYRRHLKSLRRKIPKS